VSGVPFNPTTKPYDAWGAYGRERQEVLDFIHANAITGVVVISGDLHTGGALDRGVNAGLPEVSVPHTNLPTTQQSSGVVGKWSEGFVSGVVGGGYTLVTVRADGVVLENRGADGLLRQQMFLQAPIAPGTSLSISATSAYKNEGNIATTPFTFTVTRGGNISGATTVSYVVSGVGVSMVNTADFGGAFPRGSVSFASGQTIRTVTINVTGDGNWEPNETFSIALSNATGGAQITAATATGTILNDDLEPASSGLLGYYFNGINLTDPAGTRVDATVNFSPDWGSKPAGTSVIADDNYSVRWTGFVQTSAAGAWTFYTKSNDGVRLWIDNVLLINNWTRHAVVENSATISLSAGWHAIRLEYFQHGGVAVISLSFRGPDQTKTIIPQAKLRTTFPTGGIVSSNTLLRATVTDSIESKEASPVVNRMQASTPLIKHWRDHSEPLNHGQGTLAGSSGMLTLRLIDRRLGSDLPMSFLRLKNGGGSNVLD
jgi:hypothetical protein